MKYEFRWNDWNHDHIGNHGVRYQEAEFVVSRAKAPYSRYEGDGKFVVRGQSFNGAYLQVIYLQPSRRHLRNSCPRAHRFRETPLPAKETIMKRKVQKSYNQMTAAELADATAQYDKEFIGTPGKPLSTAQKALHRRAAKRGRPRVGLGAERINITVERTLLNSADRFAKSLGLTRAQLVARALSRELAQARKTG